MWRLRLWSWQASIESILIRGLKAGVTLAFFAWPAFFTMLLSNKQSTLFPQIAGVKPPVTMLFNLLSVRQLSRC